MILVPATAPSTEPSPELLDSWRSALPKRQYWMPADDDSAYIALRRRIPKRDDAHDPDITAMLRGEFRAECSCGFWSDHHYVEAALAALNDHFKGQRRERQLRAAARRRHARLLGVSLREIDPNWAPDYCDQPTATAS